MGMDELGAGLLEAVADGVVPLEGLDVPIDEEVVGGSVVALDGDLVGEFIGGVTAAIGAGEMEVIATGVLIGGLGHEEGFGGSGNGAEFGAIEMRSAVRVRGEEVVDGVTGDDAAVGFVLVEGAAIHVRAGEIGGKGIDPGGAGLMGGLGDGIGVIVGIHARGESDLAEAVGAFGGVRLTFGLGQGGQEHAGEDRDNRDHHQQFDQCKTSAHGDGA